MTEVINQVYETTDYSLFTKTDNRDVVPNRKLELELLTHGQRQPIIVNEKMEIIDGQHRFYHLKKNGMSIKYIVDANASFETIISMNTSAKNWSLNDFINAYANKGKPSFIDLNNFIKEHPLLSINTIVVAGAARRSGTHSNVVAKLKNGQYDFINKKQLKEFYDFFETVIITTSLPNKPFLQSALWTIFTVENFDKNRMLKQLKKNNITAESIEGYAPKKILVTLLETYNGRWNDDNPKTIQYYTNRKGALIIPQVTKK
ncbi:TPA: ParB N-terminal domain-containing protein [Streptococcus suis]|nr:ParB N-terminal domain-containing protein [Streptococcus suis]HEL1809204.1 ParB N-terminal domain-containing protein [Streptococcus suis]HEM5080787.1 ParB N-terminal domain-containing protein [Streptococcus suis]HEM5137964.1 ParB N-terminal domain-containing protein [Streptococcus suis]